MLQATNVQARRVRVVLRVDHSSQSSIGGMVQLVPRKWPLRSPPLTVQRIQLSPNFLPTDSAIEPFFPATTSNGYSKPHLSWVNAIPFADTPTIHSSPCWRVPGFACRKQSISVFRTSPQTDWSFAVQSSAKAVSFPFTRPLRLAWNSTSGGGAPIPHEMITYSFPCGGARCFCMTPKPHSTT